MSSVCEPRTGRVWVSPAGRLTQSLQLPKPVSTTHGKLPFLKKIVNQQLLLFVDESYMCVWYITISVVIFTTYINIIADCIHTLEGIQHGCEHYVPPHLFLEPVSQCPGVLVSCHPYKFAYTDSLLR